MLTRSSRPCTLTRHALTVAARGAGLLIHCPPQDADGLTAQNLGKLIAMGDKAPLIPCTPKGCIELLDRAKIAIDGASPTLASAHIHCFLSFRRQASGGGWPQQVGRHSCLAAAA